MYKVGVVGDKDSILGFKALGMSVFPVTSALEHKRQLKKLLPCSMQLYTLQSSSQRHRLYNRQIQGSQTSCHYTHPGNQGSLVSA